MAHFAESFNLLTACWSVLGVRAMAWGVVVPDVMTLTLPLPIRTETGWRKLSLGGARGFSIGWYLANGMLEGMCDHSAQSCAVRWQRMSCSVSRNQVHP